MKTIAPRPTRSLRSLQDEVSRMFDGLFPTSWNDDTEEGRLSMWTPRMDFTETDDAFHLHVDLPGLEKEDVHISVEDNRLTIRGERDAQTTTESENMIRMERTFGTFYRSVRLPKTVQEDKISATFLNGVLRIDAPKSEVSKPKRISIS